MKSIFKQIFLLVLVCLVKSQEKDFMNVPVNQISCKPKHKISCSDSKYYSFDGSCNNLKVPWLGKVDTPFSRFTPSQYDDGISALKTKSNKRDEELPNVHTVSSQVHYPRKKPSPTRHRQYSHFFTNFGQLVTFDITRIGGFPVVCKCSEPKKECANMPTPGNPEQKCINFARARPSTEDFDCQFRAKQGINTVTHWLDLSTIYGSTENKTELIGENGLLKTSNNQDLKKTSSHDFLLLAEQGVCPADSKQFRCFKAGDVRVNENMPLASTFTLFLREHNRVAKKLKQINPKWNSNKIFQEARRIVIAIYQNIIFKDYLPLLLGRQFVRKNKLDVKRDGYSMNYDENINPQITLEFSVAAFRFGHSMVPGHVSKANSTYDKLLSLNMVDLIFNPRQAYIRGGLDPFIYSLVVDSSSEMDAHLTEALYSRLLLPNVNEETKRSSLSMINIQRGRDVGLPGYNRLREFCDLKPIRSFNRAGNVFIRESIPDLRRVYRNIPNDIDAWTGLISERHMRGAGIGETTACIIAKQFKNLKEGDRFYYEHGHDRQTRFTPEQLNAIRSQTLSNLVCYNYDTNKVLKNVFLPPNPRTNKFINCSQLSSINLSLWRE